MNDLKSKLIARTPPNKRGLTPEIQARIGHQLRNMFDDIVRQGVPERFAELIRKLDSSTTASPESDAENLETQTSPETRRNAGGD